MNKLIIISLVLAVAVASCSAKKGDVAKTTENNKKTEHKMGTIELTKADFLTKVTNFEKNPNEWIFLGDKPCIIDFYATWCGPCKMLSPILEELSHEYAGKVNFYKVNTEEQQELAAAFGIQSIPSLLFCPMKGKPQMAMGALPKETLKQAINEVLLKQPEPAK
jgi:thioredoxin